jgi:hypothetical protein
MRVNDKYEHALKEIIERLTAIRTFNPDGRPAFKAGEYSLIISILESAIDFHPEIPHADRPQLLRKAVSDAAKGSEITPELLRKHLAGTEKEYLKKPLQDFVLATAFAMEGHRDLKTTRINGVRISFAASLPRRFDRSAIADRIEDVAPNILENVTHVLARVSARTPNAAFDHAQTSVDLIRALWNFILIYGSYQLLQTGSHRPLNAILPGRVHTLHQPDGTLIEEIFWYEPQAFSPQWVYVANEKWPAVLKRASKLLGRLRSLPYRGEIEDALVRYVRALDDADARSSFNRMWSVLEYLADSVGSYEKLITRASYVSRDDERTLVRMLLQHLRDVRNAVVHADKERSNIRTYLDQVKLATERLIMFHFRNGRRFGSRAALASFLDTPVDHAVLKQRMKDYRWALKHKW